jgi:hypothetical protein
MHHDEFVGEHAGGLLYMAGPTFTGRFSATRGPAASRRCRSGWRTPRPVSRLLDCRSENGRLPVESQLDHPVLRFEAWRRHAKSGGRCWGSSGLSCHGCRRRVLLEHSDPAVSQLPVIAAGGGTFARATLLPGSRGRGVATSWLQRGFFNRFWVTRFLIEGRMPGAAWSRPRAQSELYQRR